MAEYSYIVINKDGQQIKGTLEGVDQEAVKNRLRMDGLVIVSVKKVSFLTKDIKIGGDKKVKHRDLSVFCRQFSAILAAGVPVVEALNILYMQTVNPTLKDALDKTAESVRQGMTLSASMQKFPKVFPDMFVNMVEAGEISGNLDKCVERMGIQFEKDAKLSGMLKKAMIYPIAVFSVAIVVIILMSIIAVPKFSDIFTMMGADLPLSTKMIMTISDFIMYKWYVGVAVVVCVVLILRYIGKTEKGKDFYANLALKIPIIGPVNIKTNCAKFARTMSTMIVSGMSIVTSIEITARTMKNVKYKKALDYAKSEVEQGVNLSRPLKESEVFPPMICNMIAIGEETGHVEDMLDRCADYYEEEAEIQTGIMTESMQPLIIIVLGIIVGVMVLALYQPMIGMYDKLEGL